jgi:FixJ family two-component response regulator
VFVVNDDISSCAALKSLVRSVGLRVELFGSSREFLQGAATGCAELADAGCQVHPEKAGSIFSAKLVAANIHVPIIFIAGHGDIPMSVRAKKAGAVEFLTKPFRDQDLLDAIQLALKRDVTRRAQEAEVAILR